MFWLKNWCSSTTVVIVRVYYILNPFSSYLVQQTWLCTNIAPKMGFTYKAILTVASGKPGLVASLMTKHRSSPSKCWLRICTHFPSSMAGASQRLASWNLTVRTEPFGRGLSGLPSGNIILPRIVNELLDIFTHCFVLKPLLKHKNQAERNNSPFINLMN